jgi:ribonuclease HI
VTFHKKCFFEPPYPQSIPVFGQIAKNGESSPDIYQEEPLSSTPLANIVRDTPITKSVNLSGKVSYKGVTICLKSQWTQNPTASNQGVLVSKSQAAQVKLLSWLDRSNTNQGVPSHTVIHQVQLYTDSSTQGWGAHLDFKEISGTWSQREKQMHINNLELKAAFLALKHWKSLLSGKKVLIVTDNTSVVAYVNNQGGTCSRSLCVQVVEMFRWCHQENIQIKAKHIPGRLNVLTDTLSREVQIVNTEWSLCPQIFSEIYRKFSAPNIDLFATRYNTKLMTYVSPIPDPQAYAVDALSMDWKNWWAYAYPPMAIIPQVLTKIRTENCQVLLVAPANPSAPWYQDMLDLLIDQPVSLPVVPKLLKQPRTNMFHWNPACLRLHVWILSNDRLKQKDFLMKQQDAYPRQSEVQLATFMTPSGEYSWLGVLKRKLIRSRPLRLNLPSFF